MVLLQRLFQLFVIGVEVIMDCRLYFMRDDIGIRGFLGVNVAASLFGAFGTGLILCACCCGNEVKCSAWF